MIINKTVDINTKNIYTDYKSAPAPYAGALAFCGGMTKLTKCTADEFVSLNKPKQGFKKNIADILTPKKKQAPKSALNTQNPTPPKIADNLHDLIVDLTGKTSYANGKDAVVYPVPQRDDLVLRIEKSVLPKIDTLSKDLILVPIKFEKSTAENKNLGLPLYLAAERGSEIAQKSSITPLDAMNQKDKIMVLRKMSGQHPSQEYWDNLTVLMGYDDFNPSIAQLQNFKFLGYMRKLYGNDAAITCLENCKNGMPELKVGQLGKDSPAYKFADGEMFAKNYRNFADSYIKSLENISQMPQKAYDKAVQDILAPKDFIMDFQHTDNTFVDFEKNEFNFMDFCYDKNLYPKYYYDNPIKEFRNVLMGKCFARGFKSPRCLIIYPNDIQKVKTHSNNINEKVNAAAPEKFRSANPYKIV